jgi:hypothetical protein
MRTDLLKIRDFVLTECDDVINWKYLSQNPRAIHLLRENPTKINFEKAKYNKAAIELPNFNYSYYLLFQNTECYLEEINIFDEIERKEIKDNLIKMQSLPSNQYAILWHNIALELQVPTRFTDRFLEELSKNPDDIEMLKKYPNKIDKKSIWSNPMIFTYDYDKIKIIFADLNKEYYAAFYHPKRINMWDWTLDE